MLRVCEQPLYSSNVNIPPLVGLLAKDDLFGRWNKMLTTVNNEVCTLDLMKPVAASSCYRDSFIEKHDPLVCFPTMYIKLC